VLVLMRAASPVRVFLLDPITLMLFSHVPAHM
jgi:hypothetical protein